MSDTNIETEWQFEVDDLGRVRAWLESQPDHAPLRFTLIKDAEQVDSYYDTADWRLFFAGYSLRRRRRDDRFEVTLKSLARASDGPISRTEINEASADGQIPAPDGAAGPVSDRVRTIAGRAPLGRLFEVRTHRRSYAVRADEVTVAQVELDETTIAPLVLPASAFRRVEVEMAGGSPSADVESFVQAMRYANDLTPTTTSKYEAGLAAASLVPSAVLDFGPIERDAEAGAAEYACAWLREQWAAFLYHAPGTRLGEDIEALHQMRVATRRLRASIRVFDAVLPPSLEVFRDELQWVGHELGAVRDLDVQIEGLERLRAASSWDDAAALRPLIEVIGRERDAERVRLLELLDSPRYDALVTGFSAALREGPPVGTPTLEVHAYAEPILAGRYQRVRRDGKRLTSESAAAEYHDLRIRAKRLRYSLEVFGGLYGRPAERVTAALKALQDMLGEHQDAEVGIARLHTIVASYGRELPPTTLVAVGRLIEQYRQQGSSLRADFPDAFERVLDRWRPLARVASRLSRPKRSLQLQLDAEEAENGDEAAADGSPPAGEAARPAARDAAAPRSELAPPASDTTRRAAADLPMPELRSDPSDGGSLSRMRQLFHSD